MRDYVHIERYLNELMVDVYPQPPDDKQTGYTREVVDGWVASLAAASVLDVGCGQGTAIEMLRVHAARVEGVTLGEEDLAVCRAKGLAVQRADMSFLPYGGEEFDLIFARHVLEHSPAPLLTLMEWHRVSHQWLCVIVPSLSAFGAGGRNHYCVLLPDQWETLFARAGWHVIWRADSATDFEHRFMCEKVRDAWTSAT